MLTAAHWSRLMQSIGHIYQHAFPLATIMNRRRAVWQYIRESLFYSVYSGYTKRQDADSRHLKSTDYRTAALIILHGMGVRPEIRIEV